MKGREKHAGEDDEEQRDAVHAELVVEAQEPLPLLHELEARVGGVEARQDEQGRDEGDDRGRKGDPLGVPLRGSVLPAQKQQGEGLFIADAQK